MSFSYDHISSEAKVHFRSGCESVLQCLSVIFFILNVVVFLINFQLTVSFMAFRFFSEHFIVGIVLQTITALIRPDSTASSSLTYLTGLEFHSFLSKLISSLYVLFNHIFKLVFLKHLDPRHHKLPNSDKNQTQLQ